VVKNKSERIKNWVTNKKNWKLIMGPLLFVATIFVAARTVDLNQYLEIVQKWVWQFGPWGAVAFVTMYITATLFFLPGLPFTLIAAFLFGSFKGFFNYGSDIEFSGSSWFYDSQIRGTRGF
jgi:uncharacterized membrane protein YdjX (TVP38/TMEM64 family)